MEYGNIDTREGNAKKTELIKVLVSCQHDDEPAVAHERADRALLSYIGDADVREQFDRIKKHYV